MVGDQSTIIMIMCIGMCAGVCSWSKHSGTAHSHNTVTAQRDCCHCTAGRLQVAGRRTVLRVQAVAATERPANKIEEQVFDLPKGSKIKVWGRAGQAHAAVGV